MEQYKLGDMEAKFARLIWDNAPIGSGALVKLCEEELHWKKSTTYTMLKRLCKREIFQNEGGIVTARLSADEFAAAQGEQFLDETFHGSLPLFLAAFTRRNKLNPTDIAQLQRLIDEMKEK